jgi:iron-sulfur cluster assembly accessory protein
MLNEIESKTISISQEAAQTVQVILKERKLEGYALRVFASGASCCGNQFGMALDNNFNDTDSIVEMNGVKMVVDKTSLEYLRGSSIEFVSDPVKGKGFVVNNPNWKKSGGDGEKSSCGGSCSCNN